ADPQAFTGQDTGLDVGFNFYLNPDTKLSLFYAHRSGKASAEGAANTNNTYFQQAIVGPVQRGKYLGTGLVIIF
ncbi:MAG: hypothetical protein WA952_05285, partial [Lewinella sp.]